MPQYFKENNPIINLGLKSMSEVLSLQYQKEERTRLLIRVKAAGGQLEALLNSMRNEELSSEENVRNLRSDLSDLYGDRSFLKCNTMGDLISTSLEMLETYSVRKKPQVRLKFKVPVT
jgi:hypothetical protein